MKLERKKALVARTLGIGKSRVYFNSQRLSELKEAITKQDIKDLIKTEAIIIKEIKGRKVKVKRKTRIRAGSRRRIIINKKREYINLVRKLRNYLKALKKQGKISKVNNIKILTEIKARKIKNISQIRDMLIKEPK